MKQAMGMFLAAVTAVLISAAAAEASGPGAGQQGKLRYVTAGPDGARARNLYDTHGVIVLDVPSGTVLAVHGERAGWFDVEAPGGFKVWVYGQYVRGGSKAGVVQISGSNVRMRPLPSSGPESLPLRQQLSLGDEVRLIRRNDESRLLSEDWVQVWSPPGARAWVKANETVPLPASADGAELWAGSVAVAAARPTSGVAVKPAAATREGSAPPTIQETADATQVLGKADSLLAAERTKDEQGGVPNYAVVVAAYESVLSISDSGPTADQARGRIQLVNSYADAYDIRVELESQRAELLQAQVDRDSEREAARTRGPYDGRFEARGWLIQKTITGETKPRWLLSWSGGDVAEIVCTSGRYDLSVFGEYEIGVDGRVIQGPVAGVGDSSVRPRRVDVDRIEVISGRAH